MRARVVLCSTLLLSGTASDAVSIAALRVQIGANDVLEPIPPFACCHPNTASYDSRLCAVRTPQANNSSFIAANQVAVQSSDVGCLPQPDWPCHLDYYPEVVVNGSSVDTVAAVVKFAAQYNVTLNIKATGHDYNGRSLRAGPLSVWTRYLQHFQVDEAFVPEGCADCAPERAITLGAGLQTKSAVAMAAVHNLTLITAADPDVGVAGHLLGGGHSPLSGIYGLAADQVLQVELVTADGAVRIVNQAQQAELFWALRGSGTATYGVVTRVVVRAHPLCSVAFATLSLSTTAVGDAFWDAIATFHALLPNMSDAGLFGYYGQQTVGSGSTSGAQSNAMAGYFFTLNATERQVLNALAPIQTYANSQNVVSLMVNTSMFDKYPDFSAAAFPAGTAGINQRLGSRLLTRKALRADLTTLSSTFRRALSGSSGYAGHLVAGKGLGAAVSHVAGGSNSVLPAWRHTISHLAVVASWKPFDDEGKKQAITRLTQEQVPALARLDDSAGSYLNEASLLKCGNPCESDWERIFYGVTTIVCSL